MKVKDLIALLAKEDPDAVVVVAGFETVASNDVAEVDMLTACTTAESREDSMTGNRKVVSQGEATVWLGWTDDYRTKSFLDAVANPGEYATE
ncbi:hypothetical protein QEL91_004126 [Pseudomonas putida]|nr:hypothetical protein [Pseudomonas putida]